MNTFDYNFGDMVRDIYTDYKGVVTARCEYQFSPNTYLVEGIDSTGRPIEVWLTENRLTRFVEV